MPRKSKWNKAERKELLKMINAGVSEQEIRVKLSDGNNPMTAVEFAQQLKMAMVESGKIKQKKSAGQKKDQAVTYVVTAQGRITVSDFAERTGFKTGDEFTLEKPRGRSTAWRLVPKK